MPDGDRILSYDDLEEERDRLAVELYRAQEKIGLLTDQRDKLVSQVVQLNG